MAHMGLTALDTSKILLDEERAIIDKAFQILDRDQSGAIDKGELEYVVKKLGFGDADTTAGERMLQNVDTDDSGQITKDEFHKMMSRKLGEDVPDEELKEMIDLFEDELSSGKKKGFITYS